MISELFALFLLIQLSHSLVNELAWTHGTFGISFASLQPFDFFLEPEAETWPFAYDPVLEQELAPFRKLIEPGPRLKALLEEIPRTEQRTVDMLVALARGHIVFCRRDIARVMMALRVEFDGRDHPVGAKVADIGRDLAKRFGAVVSAGRRDGSIPPGPPAKTLGAAISAAVS